MKRYKSPSATAILMSELPMVLLTVSLGSAIIGVAAFFLSTQFWIIFLFPTALGFLGGALVKWQVKGAKLGNPTSAALVGLFAGLLIFSVFFVSDYFYFRHISTQQLAADAAYLGMTPSDLLDELLILETGSGGFLGFLKIHAREGITISQVADPIDEGIVITGAWVYVYHLVEAALIIGITTAIAVDAARQPYCAHCRNWIEKHIRLGHVANEQSAEFREALRLGSVNSVVNLLQKDQYPGPPYLDVVLGRCENSASCEGVLTLRQTSKGRYGSSSHKILDRYLVSPREADYLVNATRSPLDWEPGETSNLGMFGDEGAKSKDGGEGSP